MSDGCWDRAVTDAQGRMKERIAALERIVVDLHWMARRYADGRQSYATSTFNEHTRALLALGIVLNETGDKTIWARDRDGPAAAGLTQEEFDRGDPMPKWGPQRDVLITALRDIAEARVEFPIAFAKDLLSKMEGADA